MALSGDVSVEADVVANIASVLQAWGRDRHRDQQRGLAARARAPARGSGPVQPRDHDRGERQLPVHQACGAVDDRARHQGSIVSILSSNAWQGAPGFIAYATHKGGLANFVRAAAMDLAPYGIRVNSFTPTAPRPDNPELLAQSARGRAGPSYGRGVPLTNGPHGGGRPGRSTVRGQIPMGEAGHAHRHRALRRLAVLRLRPADHRARLRHRRRAGQVLGLHAHTGAAAGPVALIPLDIGWEPLMADMVRAAADPGGGRSRSGSSPGRSSGPTTAGCSADRGAPGTAAATWSSFAGTWDNSGRPMVPGHEPLGILEEVSFLRRPRGGVLSGHRVAVEIHPCRSCDLCLAGRYMSRRNRVGSHGGSERPWRAGWACGAGRICRVYLLAPELDPAQGARRHPGRGRGDVQSAGRRGAVGLSPGRGGAGRHGADPRGRR